MILAVIVALAGCVTHKMSAKKRKVEAPKVDCLYIASITLTNPVMQIIGGTQFITNKSGQYQLGGTVWMTAYTDVAFQLSWLTVSNRQYMLQHSPDMTNWTAFTVLFIGDGTTYTWLDRDYSGATQQFYRLTIQ